MTQTITALFADKRTAQTAVDRLLAEGVGQQDVSVLMSDSTKEKEFAVEVNTKAPEGTAIGAATGGAIGAIVAGLTAVGTITLTGGVGLVAAGPAVALLAGGGAGAAAGGAVGGLIGLGFEENEAKLVQKDLENGSILVATEIPSSRKNNVKEWMKEIGAKKVTVH